MSSRAGGDELGMWLRSEDHAYAYCHLHGKAPPLLHFRHRASGEVEVRELPLLHAAMWVGSALDDLQVGLTDRRISLIRHSRHASGDASQALEASSQQREREQPSVDAGRDAHGHRNVEQPHTAIPLLEAGEEVLLCRISLTR